MKKRLLPVLLALTLTLPLPALAKEASTGFTDVSPEDWFAPYVVVCVEEGLLNGVGEDRFAPGQALNSDEALVMAARVLLKANGEAEFPKGPDAQGFWDWAKQDAQQYSMGLSVDETQWYVDSWCWDPLVYLAQAGGPDLFPDGGITYATDRYTFFKACPLRPKGWNFPSSTRWRRSPAPGTRGYWTSTGRGFWPAPTSMAPLTVRPLSPGQKPPLPWLGSPGRSCGWNLPFRNPLIRTTPSPT